jgi:hypothetical protein
MTPSTKSSAAKKKKPTKTAKNGKPIKVASASNTPIISENIILQPF